jgi:hypothetical protein
MVQDFEAIADRFWNLSQKGEEEDRRETLLSSDHRKRFLDLCYKVDTQPSVCGFGKDNLVASGLIA